METVAHSHLGTGVRGSRGVGIGFKTQPGIERAQKQHPFPSYGLSSRRFVSLAGAGLMLKAMELLEHDLFPLWVSGSCRCSAQCPGFG